MNLRAYGFAASLAVLAMFNGAASAVQVGVWQFDNNLNNALPGGSPMVVNGGWSAAYSAATIAGNPATVLSFPKFPDTQSLQMPNQAVAPTNVWSIVMDVNFPSVTGFTALWQTDQNINGSDGDFFINNGGIGIGGNYPGAVVAGAWTRIAVTLAPSGATYELKKYIDGLLVGTQTSGTAPNGRHAVGAVLNLFADEDDETQAGLVNSVAYYDNLLSAEDIRLLGGASAGGVPAVPEPSTLALGGLAVAGLLAARRRHRRK
jgi:hypothetical protein